MGFSPSHMPTKFSIILWRIRCGFLTTFSKGNQVINTQTVCLLCQNEDDAISHLFFNCKYTRKVVLAIVDTLGQSIWKIFNTPILGSLQTDIRIGDLTEVWQKFLWHSSCWGLLWNIISWNEWEAEESHSKASKNCNHGNNKGLQHVLQAGAPQKAIHQAWITDFALVGCRKNAEATLLVILSLGKMLDRKWVYRHDHLSPLFIYCNLWVMSPY